MIAECQPYQEQFKLDAEDIPLTFDKPLNVKLPLAEYCAKECEQVRKDCVHYNVEVKDKR